MPDDALYTGDIVIPDKVNNDGHDFVVTAIDERAFYLCEELTSVSLPATLQSIGLQAFDYCEALPSISIPASVTFIGDEAFANCDAMTSIEVETGNTAFTSSKGVLFSVDMQTLIQFPGGQGGEYDIPSSVMYLGTSAFFENENLTDVSFPYNLEKINSYCFTGCSGLETVRIPSNVTFIGAGAFSYCNKLKNIFCEAATPPTLGYYDSPFRGLPSDYVIWLDESFYDDYAADPLWSTLNIKKEINDVYGYQYDELFYDLNLWNKSDPYAMLVMPDMGHYKGDIVIPENIVYENITVPVRNIYDEAFMDADELSSVVIPNSIEEIGGSAFANCTGLTEVTIPASIFQIGDNAFGGCSNLMLINCQSSYCPDITDMTFVGVPSECVVNVRRTAWDSFINHDYWKHMKLVQVPEIGDLLFTDGWAHYDTGTAIYGVTYPLAILIPANSVTDNYLSHVALYSGNESTCILKVYQGGDKPAEGTLLSEQELALELSDAYTEIKLKHSVEFDPTKNLWLVLEPQYKGVYCYIYYCELKGAPNTNARWIYDSETGTWIDAKDSYINKEIAWMVRAKFSAVPTLEVTNLNAGPITDESAVITWEGNGSNYELRYRKQGVAQDFEAGLDNWTTFEGTGTEQGAIWGHLGSDGIDDSDVAFSKIGDAWLVSPKVKLGGYITFWTRGYADIQNFAVYVSTNGNTADADWTKVTGDFTTALIWKQYAIDLSAYSGEGYIAIRSFNNANNQLLDNVEIVTDEWHVTKGLMSKSQMLVDLESSTTYIVQVRAIKGTEVTEWEEIRFETLKSTKDEEAIKNVIDLINAIGTVTYPDSKDPIEAARKAYDELADNLKDEVTNYSYLQYAEDMYEYEKQEAMSIQNIAVDPKYNSASVTWESQNESYEIHYRKMADDLETFEDGLGGWTTIDADGDGFKWDLYSTGGVYSTSYDIATMTDLSPDNYLVSPLRELGGTMTFFARDMYHGEHFAIYVSTESATDPAKFTQVSEEFIATGDGKFYTIDLSAYSGQQGYVAFRHFNISGGFNLYIANIEFNAPEWKIEKDIKTTSFAINGLEAEKNYYLFIYGYSEGTLQSSSYTEFTTPAMTPEEKDLEAARARLQKLIGEYGALAAVADKLGNTAIKSILESQALAHSAKLTSNDIAVLNTEINNCLTELNGYISLLLPLAKAQVNDGLDALLLPTDSEACKKIIADAQAAINALEWSEEHTIAMIVSEATAIASQAESDLKAQRSKEAGEETGLNDVQSDRVQSTKVLINGQLFILRGEQLFDINGRQVR